MLGGGGVVGVGDVGVVHDGVHAEHLFARGKRHKVSWQGCGLWSDYGEREHPQLPDNDAAR